MPLVYDTERVRPHIEWLIATPSMIDVNMIRTLVERIDHDVDYYTFESHEDYVLFWDAVIDWIFDLIGLKKNTALRKIHSNKPIQGQMWKFVSSC